jgi:hypothetical protein
MMRGAGVGGEEVVWRFLGCAFMMRAYMDDYMFPMVGAFGYAAPTTAYPA